MLENLCHPGIIRAKRKIRKVLINYILDGYMPRMKDFTC